MFNIAVEKVVILVYYYYLRDKHNLNTLIYSVNLSAN